MKRCLLLMLSILVYIPIIAQNKEDTVHFGIGISSYSYAYSTKFNDGSVAYGPSLLLGKRLRFQLSFLAETRGYYVTPFDGQGYQVTHSSSGPPPERNTKVFLELLYHYRYYNGKKMALYITTGLTVGGEY